MMMMMMMIYVIVLVVVVASYDVILFGRSPRCTDVRQFVAALRGWIPWCWHQSRSADWVHRKAGLHN